MTEEPVDAFDVTDGDASMQKLQKAFNAIDVDGDGYLDYGEFSLALAEIGYFADVSQAQQEIAKFDTDQDGQLTFLEFVNVMAHVHSQADPFTLEMRPWAIFKCALSAILAPFMIVIPWLMFPLSTGVEAGSSLDPRLLSWTFHFFYTVCAISFGIQTSTLIVPKPPTAVLLAVLVAGGSLGAIYELHWLWNQDVRGVETYVLFSSFIMPGVFLALLTSLATIIIVARRPHERPAGPSEFAASAHMDEGAVTTFLPRLSGLVPSLPTLSNVASIFNTSGGTGRGSDFSFSSVLSEPEFSSLPKLSKKSRERVVSNEMDFELLHQTLLEESAKKAPAGRPALVSKALSASDFSRVPADSLVGEQRSTVSAIDVSAAVTHNAKPFLSSPPRLRRKASATLRSPVALPSRRKQGSFLAWMASTSTVDMANKRSAPVIIPEDPHVDAATAALDCSSSFASLSASYGEGGGGVRLPPRGGRTMDDLPRYRDRQEVERVNNVWFFIKQYFFMAIYFSCVLLLYYSCQAFTFFYAEYTKGDRLRQFAFGVAFPLVLKPAELLLYFLGAEMDYASRVRAKVVRRIGSGFVPVWLDTRGVRVQGARTMQPLAVWIVKLFTQLFFRNLFATVESSRVLFAIAAFNGGKLLVKYPGRMTRRFYDLQQRVCTCSCACLRCLQWELEDRVVTFDEHRKLLCTQFSFEIFSNALSIISFAILVVFRRYHYNGHFFLFDAESTSDEALFSRLLQFALWMFVVETCIGGVVFFCIRAQTSYNAFRIGTRTLVLSGMLVPSIIMSAHVIQDVYVSLLRLYVMSEPRAP